MISQWTAQFGGHSARLSSTPVSSDLDPLHRECELACSYTNTHACTIHQSTLLHTRTRASAAFPAPTPEPCRAWLPATQTTQGMADPELQAGPGPSPPACQASQSLRARSPELLPVPALLTQEPLNESAPPASSTTGRGRTTQRVQGDHCTPDDAAPHQPHPHAPHGSAQAGRFLRSQRPPAPHMFTLIHSLPCPGWAPGSLP